MKTTKYLRQDSRCPGQNEGTRNKKGKAVPVTGRGGLDNRFTDGGEVVSFLPPVIFVVLISVR
jgi:hypothetical protein